MAWEFGHYRMEELVARGGMGEVHRAYDLQHDRVVAIKLLGRHVAEDDDYRRRFMREARAAARLREPHVIPIHAFGEIDGQLYLDMRLVEGHDLSAMLKTGGPLDPAVAVDVIGQVASALDAAHADGLVHRDVKPSNVLLDAGGFAYLVDFGIARSMTTNADITGTGIPIGSVTYMAPERFRPEPVDHRVDVYSLACLLYQCLTGVPPFRGGNALALMHAHLNHEPPRPTEHRPDLPPAFDEVIATGMAKDPQRRFPSAGALAAAAKHALARPWAPQPTTQPAPPAPRRAGGRGWLVGAATLVLVALAGAAALVWVPGLNDDSSANRAPTGTTEPTEPPSEETSSADLSVSVPLSTPACDGSYIILVGSAVNPPRYQRDVQAFLDAHPGAEYLHAPTTGCRSLRGRTETGEDIYAVYYGPYVDKETACDEQASVGGDSIVRRLDDSSAPEKVGCGPVSVP